MKRILNFQVILGLILIILSALTYYVHFLIFRDTHHIFLYLIGDIAFLFIEVLLVTLVLHGLLMYREKKALLTKLNMVISVFFSEVGTELMRAMSAFDTNALNNAKHLVITGKWTDRDFGKAQKYVLAYSPIIDRGKLDLGSIKEFLLKKRDFLLRLLENPNLLEHESFTNLLWAVFHFTDELCHRGNLDALPDADLQHLAGDIKRVYDLLISEWLMYMNHLRINYPYLFSLATRTNPFDATASVELT